MYPRPQPGAQPGICKLNGNVHTNLIQPKRMNALQEGHLKMGSFNVYYLSTNFV